MSSGVGFGRRFSVATSITAITRLINLSTGVLISVVLARVLGPEGRGIYALVMLLPSLIVIFSSLGIEAATVYYVARKKFYIQEVLGNNVLLSISIGSIGVIIGLIIIVFFREQIFPRVDSVYLFISLLFIPLQIFSLYIKYILLGLQHIVKFNIIQIIQSIFFAGMIIFLLLVLKLSVIGAIIASLSTWLVVDVITFYLTYSTVNGINLKLNLLYISHVIKYGFQAYLSNILGFLNYRLDVFLVSSFLDPKEVGFYTVGVGLAEQLWMFSQVASVILFPRVAAETENTRQKNFTPLVARTVLWVTTGGTLVLALFSQEIIKILYSESFLPVVGALRALLAGVVMLSVSRILASDIAGRGRPALNAYRGLVTVFTNVVLNLLWIPRYGIVGSAWASTVAYTVSFIGALFMYCYLSGNPWTVVLLPQPGDWTLYKKIIRELWRWGLNQGKYKFINIKVKKE